MLTDAFKTASGKAFGRELTRIITTNRIKRIDTPIIILSVVVMAKRSWAEISTLMEATLQEQENGIKKAKQETCSVLAYETLKNKEISLQTKVFAELVYNTSNTFNYQVRDNALKKTFRGSYQTPVTIRNFKDYFEDGGHGLAYNFTSSYITPLILDLDCLHCKQNKCTEPISIVVVNTIVFTNITETIATLCKIPLHVVKANTLIFKKEQECNLHVYTGFSCSIILYDILRCMIEANFSVDVQERYSVDNITVLDLPYSSKNGTDIYKPTEDNDGKLDIVISPTSTFYEVPLQTTVHFQHVNAIILGKFTTVNQSTDWYDENINLIYLTTPAEVTGVYQTTIISSYIKNIKISHVKFITTRKILDLYFSGEAKQETGLLDASIVDNLGDSEHEKAVHHTLLSLSDKITKLVFREKIVSQHRKLSYLLKFLTIDQCGYAFYLVMATISYVINTTSKFSNVDVNCYKLTTLDVLHRLAEEHPMLVRTINMIKNFNVYVRLEPIFKDPILWFSEIAKQVGYMGFDNYRSFLLSQVKVYDTLQRLKEELLTLCSMELPLIRNDVDSSAYYYYSKGRYLEIREQAIITINQNLKVKTIFNNMVEFCKQLEEEHQISPELHKEADEKFLKEVWFKYLNSVPIKKPLTNMYDYFISCELGVFNTITGLYMNHTPLLYMSAQKLYCTTPTSTVSSNCLMDSVNKYIANDYMKNEEILTEIITRQRELFYLSVMVPGFLTLQDTMCSTQDGYEIIRKISNTILYDESLENERKIYYLFPVLLHYKLSIPKLVYLYKYITLMSRFEIPALKAACLRQEEPYVEPEQFDYSILSDVERLYCELEKQPQFNFKGFALTIMLCVLDQCNDEILQDLFSTPIVDEAIVIPPAYEEFTLNPFNRQDYTCGSNTNFKRALSMVIKKHTFNEAAVNLFASLSNTFNFNSYVLDDFLHFSAMIYYPGSERKRILLMIGSQSCGKTTIQDAFYRMQPLATFSIDSIVQGNSGPAPELIKVYTSYLFNIVELKTISPDIMKTLTGGDLQFKRPLYQNEYKEMKPLAFTIAASNSIPAIPGADEAIKVRIAPFIMNSMYDNLKNHEDNPLILNIKNVLIKSPTFNIHDFAVELSNFLYAQFCLKRDEFGLITPTINEQNEPSNQLLSECLTRNNYIYNLLERSNIKFDETLSITDEELRAAMEDSIQEYNLTTQKKKLTFGFIKKNMDTLFVRYINVNHDGYNGMGIKKEKKDSDEIFELVFENGTTCRIAKIKSYMLTHNFTKYDIDEKIAKLKIEYSDFYNVARNLFRDHKLIKKL